MCSMSDGETASMTKRRLWMGPGTAAAVSFFACVLVTATGQLLHFTLEPLNGSHFGLALYFGLFFGGLIFFVIVGPFQLLIALIGRWRKLKARTISFLMLIPVVLMTFEFVHSAFSRKDPSKEVKRFEGITGAPWPTGAKMLLAEQGWGLQDKRHLWLFEGTSEQFEKLVRDRGWYLQDGTLPQEISQWMPVKKAIHQFSKDSTWSVHEVYFWEADKDAEKGPFGPGYLITDKEHRRWCVWWDAI